MQIIHHVVHPGVEILWKGENELTIVSAGTQVNVPTRYPTYSGLLGKFQAHVVEPLLLSNGCFDAGLPVISKSVELVELVLDVLSATLHSIHIVVVQVTAVMVGHLG